MAATSGRSPAPLNHFTPSGGAKLCSHLLTLALTLALTLVLTSLGAPLSSASPRSA